MRARAVFIRTNGWELPMYMYVYVYVLLRVSIYVPTSPLADFSKDADVNG